MKLARFSVNGQTYSGRYADETLVTDDGTRYDPAAVTWLPPVAPGSKMIGLALNYRDHAAELKLDLPPQPVLFNKNPNTLIGHQEQVVAPGGIEYMHYENELVVVIGQRCRRVSAAQALDRVQGYTIGNDITIRDFVTNWYRPPVKAKNWDTFGPLGPWLVTADEIPDPSGLDLRTFVNGDLRQTGNTRDLIHTIPALIEYISEFMTLEPGDMIWTGTPKGIAHIVPGDVLRLEIEGIGALQNTVVGEDSVVTGH
jgi:5-oxopent-3-ene-1,2,5-tricarboxylate decarboxylase / 2-hydroxyhepta-2,4-diene-1,7-dioate isomerase